MTCCPSSEPLPRNEDEEHAKRSIDQNSDSQDHNSTLSKKRANVRLAYAGEVKRGVLAETDEGKNGIQRILIRSKEIYTDSEGQDLLE